MRSNNSYVPGPKTRPPAGRGQMERKAAWRRRLRKGAARATRRGPNFVRRQGCNRLPPTGLGFAVARPNLRSGRCGCRSLVDCTGGARQPAGFQHALTRQSSTRRAGSRRRFTGPARFSMNRIHQTRNGGPWGPPSSVAFLPGQLRRRAPFSQPSNLPVKKLTFLKPSSESTV